MRYTTLSIMRKLIEDNLKIGSSPLFLCLALLVNRMGAMTKMMFPMYLVSASGYTVSEATALMTTYGVGLFFGAFALGAMADHFATKRIARIAFLSSAVFLALLMLVNDRTLLAIVLSAAGLADSGANVLGQRLLLDTAVEHERPQAQALLRVGNNLGAAIAGIVCGALALLDFRVVFAFDAACSLGAACIIANKIHTIQQPTRNVRPGKLASGNPFGDPPFLLLQVGVLLVAVSYHALYLALGNYIVQESMGNAAALGIQFAINGALIVLTQVKLTTILRSKDPQLVIATGAGLLAVGFGLLFAASSFSALVVSTIVWTLGEMMLFPAVSMEVMRRAEHRLSGRYFGLAGAAWNSAALIAPIAIAAISTTVRLRYIWIGCALACVVAALIMLAAIRMFNERARGAQIGV